jgi:hypothetical protein
MALLDADETLKRCQFVANALDSAVPVPGTNRRIGLDSVVGVLPVAGDAITAAAASYIVLESARLGAPRSTVARMAFNVVLDFGVGSIPVVGDVFDAFFKASRRNVELLEDHLDVDGAPEDVGMLDDGETTD